MPVEPRDDLVGRLREPMWTHSAAPNAFSSPQLSIEDALEVMNEAATRIASDAKRIAELEAEINHAAVRYDLAIASRLEWRRQAECAERALAEERDKNQWRTIDSAPRDGTRFLAWWNNAHVITYWAERVGFSGWQAPAMMTVAAHDRSAWNPIYWKPLDVPDATAIRSGKPDGKE